MNAMGGLLFLVIVCLWHQAVSLSSQQFGLSESTIPTNREGQSTVSEGDSVQICFRPTSTPTAPSVVSVKTRDGTAEAPGDYTELEIDLTFTEDDAQCVWLYTFLDTVNENNEVFTIEATGTSGPYSNINIEVTVTIANEGTRGSSISFEHASYPVVESAGEVAVCATYYGTQTLASDATVQLSTVDNPIFPGQSPASAGSDYTPEAEDLVFPAGSAFGTRRCITIKITDDGIDEGEELIQLQLTSQSGVTLGPHTSADVLITENELVIARGGGSSGDGGDGGDGKGDGGDGGDGGDNGTPSTGGTGGVRNAERSTHKSLSVLFLVLTVALAVLNTQ